MIKQKNAGLCFDDDGTSKFSCNCTPQYLGERCEVDRCSFYECQNNGTCFIDVINGIPTPTCECPETHHGTICNLLACDVPCYNDGICDGEICHCSQENGIAKYYGESCGMPAACDGYPCQNGGMCKSFIQASNKTQDYFIINIK